MDGVGWLLAALGISAALGAVWWWLERPLFHHCKSSDLLEDFLGDLVSERSPWPTMEVHLRNRHLITFRRERSSSGFFDLVLDAPDGSLQPIDIGPTSSANVRIAADAGRSALTSLGIAHNVSLKIRYGGPMDPVVVARTRAANRPVST